LRFHYAPALIAAAIWQNRANLPRWRCLVLGGAPVLFVIGGALDAVTWGQPFQSIWLNLLRNSVDGYAASVGHEPWYFYVRNAWWMWQWGAVLLPLAVIGAIRLPVIGLTAAVVVLSHSMIAHKEYRHIYLALACAAILLGAGASSLVTFCRARLGANGAVASLIVLMALAAGLSARSATTGLQAKRFHQDRALLLSFLATHDQPDLCGLGVKGFDWVDTGGYSYLHRDVPIYLADFSDAYREPGTSVIVHMAVLLRGHEVPQFPGASFGPNASRFNDLIAPPDGAEPGFVPVACFSDATNIAGMSRACLFHRPGPCVAPR